MMAVLEKAKHFDGRGLKTFVGLVANRFGASTSLRYCSECAAAQSLCGSPIWLRIHQLPAVSICLEHGRPLIELMPQNRFGNRHSLLLPDLTSARPVEVLDRDRETRFARLSAELLEAGGAGKSAAGHASAYRMALRRGGFMRGNCQINWPSLRRALDAGVCGGGSFRHRERLSLTNDVVPSWIRTALGARQAGLHPICHIALIDTLFSSVEELVTDVDACTGSLAENEPDQNSDMVAAILDDRSLSCRQAAARLGLAVTTVSLRRKRIGVPVISLAVAETAPSEALLRDVVGSDSIANLAAKHCVSTSAIYRLLSVQPELRCARTASAIDETRRTLRELWQRARRKAPLASIAMLRAAAPAAYAWLRRHDKDWLTQNLPDRRRGTTVSRVDWAARDAELSDRVVIALKEIQELAEPRRATEGTIVRRIVAASTLEKNWDRLPKFRAALQQHSESLEVFKERVRLYRSGHRVGAKR